MNFIKSALRNHQISLTLTFIILAVGVYSLLNMSRREDPKFTIRQGLVVAPYPGASSTEVEQRVTKKMEDLLFSFNEVNKEKTHSTSRHGVGYIIVELQGNVDAPDRFWSKLQLKLKQLKQTSLPETVQGPVVKSDFGDTIALLLGVHSDKRDYRELKHYQSQIEDQLRSIPAASKIKEIGGQEEAVYVTGDTKKLSFYGLSLPQVLLAVQGENRVFPNGSITVNGTNTPFHTQGQYSNLADVKNQIISVTPSGDVIRLKDVANVQRKLKERESYMRVNGAPTRFLSVEMHQGNNIVKFGERVEQELEKVRQKLPPDVTVDQMVDQPANVKSSIDNFIEEFFIALISVVVVTILLLPFRVALVTALAIPVTVALTFTSLNGLGIELQQVSLASLIVVLGLLVDDAIVIADEYVAKLGEGTKPYEAAWRAATELNIPVLTASLTIIGSFLPLILLSGNVGEFIVSLPLTVTIAIAASYLVAMLLTPYLCYRFIKEAINSEPDDEQSFNLLNLLQTGYNKSIEKALQVPYWALGAGVLFVLIGVFFLTGINQKFFPSAERNQFVVELNMPEGTSLDRTNKAAKKVEQHLRKDKRLTGLATFVGISAPRFYYNYSSEFPRTNFAQFLVNTTSNEATSEWVHDLQDTIGSWVPDGRILAKQMQQGVPNKAPIEVRVKGNNLQELQSVGARVEQILRKTSGNYRVTNDFKEDYYGLDIIENREVANRLGITNATIAKYLAVGFEGLPISTMYEGNESVDIILRRSPDARKDFDDIRNTYLVSPITRQPVQFRDVASLEPNWQVSNINHQNGIRTLTVLSRTKAGTYPSEVFDHAKESIDHLELPAGVSIEYGGEYESRENTFSEMKMALVISLILIFLVMLFQFRNLKEVFIVLTAIPLCLPGALLGLLVLGYPFGFTAFVGLASLSGVTVRNSIILVDYANHMLKEGHSVREAAKLAGERRIRPIFLTTMAASVGVTPMIISGSEMWAPLATALAFGLIFSMFMTLIVVPVLYYLLMEENPSSSSLPKSATMVLMIVGSSFLVPSKGCAQAKRAVAEQDTADSVLTIRKARNLAAANNKKLKMAQLELEHKKISTKQARRQRLPRIETNASLFYWYHNQSRTTLPVALSSLPIVGNIPPIPFETDVILPEEHSIGGYASVGLFQPITQLFKIGTGVDAASNEVEKAKLQVSRAEAKVEFGVTKLYLGLLIQQAKLKEAQVNEDFAEEKVKSASEAVKNEELLKAQQMGLKADRLDKSRKTLKIKNKQKKYRQQLAQLLDLPLDTTLTLKEPTATYLDSTYQRLKKADTITDSVRQAQTAFKKAKLGERASKQDYIPDITLFASGAFTKGLPLVPRYNTLAGINFNWEILSWGKRKMEVQKSKIKRRQAGLSLESAKEDQRINNRFRKSEVAEARSLLEAARQSYQFRKEEFRIKSDALENELILKKDWLEVKAKLSNAKRKYLQAQMNLLLKKAAYIRTND